MCVLCVCVYEGKVGALPAALVVEAGAFGAAVCVCVCVCVCECKNEYKIIFAN